MTWVPPPAKWISTSRWKAFVSSAAATLSAAAILAVAAAAGAPVDRASPFLDALVGDWRGRAVRTPRGPLPYDIRFRRAGEREVAGVADPGAALHRWRFYERDGVLRLDFLTSFGGNEEPIRLEATGSRGRAVGFRAQDRPYLDVEVEPGPERIDIRVKLRGEPHVTIRLERRREGLGPSR